ncbi:MAG: hypothetical protein AAFP76_05435 [Bacteroidota bacterium]
MKRIFLTLCIGISTLGFSQESEETEFNVADRKHELRIDATEALIVPAIEINYEYVLSKYSGVGGSVSFTIEDDQDYEQDYAVNAYYRQYFFNKKDFGARGFFAEGLLQYTGGTTLDDFFEVTDPVTGNGIIISTEEDWTAFGIGFAIGQKWVSRNGFIVEINAGGGRNLSSDEAAPDAFFRGGVLVGYRF